MRLGIFRQTYDGVNKTLISLSKFLCFIFCFNLFCQYMQMLMYLVCDD